MKVEELVQLIEKQTELAYADILRRIAVSMASFIAEIDSDSGKVADYIEQRLSPLIPLIRIDMRIRQALESIALSGATKEQP